VTLRGQYFGFEACPPVAAGTMNASETATPRATRTERAATMERSVQVRRRFQLNLFAAQETAPLGLVLQAVLERRASFSQMKASIASGSRASTRA
jgi:hypothetical protein